MQIIRTILNLYIILLIVDSILSFFPDYNSKDWRVKIRKMADYSCEPIRKKLPPMQIPIDLSPLIVIFLIEVFKFLW